MPSTKRITIERAIPYTQTDDYVEGENILAATVETAFDKSVIRDQQLRDSINRTLKLPSTTTFSGSLDVPEPVASKIIGWNSAGTALENKSLADIDASLDTVITSITSGDILQWDGSNWVNVAGTSTSFVDNVFTISDNGDNTKKVAFEASAITTGTTRILSVPDADLTLVGTNTPQTLANKTLTAPVISTISNTGTITVPTTDGTLLHTATAGIPIGIAEASTATYSSMTTVTPYDDTIPQVSEGTQVLSVSITPRASSNTIKGRVTLLLGCAGSGVQMTAHIHVNGGTNAIFATGMDISNTSRAFTLTFEFSHSPASVSAQTYTVRIGPTSSTLYLNGDGGGRKWGGVGISKITVEEIAA